MDNEADTEEFTVVSGSRSGHKREFKLMMEQQSVVVGSLSRNRGRKSPMNASGQGGPENTVNGKKFKSYAVKEGLEGGLDVMQTGESGLDVMQTGESGLDVMQNEESGFGLKSEDLRVDSVRCVAEERKMDSGESKVANLAGKESHNHGVKLETEERGSDGIPMVIDEERKIGKEERVSSETPVVVDAVVRIASPDRYLKQFSRKPKAGKINSASEMRNEDGSVKSANANADGVKSVVKEGGIGNEAPVVNDRLKSVKGDVIRLETPVVINGNCEEQNGVPEPEKSARRFTRSALKSKGEQMEISATTTSSGSSVVSDDACKAQAAAKDDNKLSDAVSPLKTHSKRKLEMKMSKKIAVNKLPSNARELLETRLLEGLAVNYLFRGNKKGGIRGIIRGHGILCSCVSCKGRKVVSLYEFEKHAGSANKHPSQNIYLENGISLHAVLTACKDAPSDTVEATIRTYIGSSSVKEVTICQNCKGSVAASSTTLAVLCDSCSQSKESGASSASVTVSKSRTLKAVASPKSSSKASKCTSQTTKKSKGKLTRKDLRLHKLVFEEDGLPDGTELAYFVRGKKLREGYKKGFGIFCDCCATVVSPSQFEAHAGWATRRKPYLNIYTSNGVSLHELSVSLSRGRKLSVSENDDLCSICAEFGDLLLCDGCPRAFHKDCVGLSTIPTGKWYCQYCLNMYEREKSCQYNENAKAAGRISGVDPIEQISRRCIRIVQSFVTEAGGCILCRQLEFSNSDFGPKTVIICDQCENEYHVGCLKDHNMADLKELPDGNWFCCGECTRIHTALQKLVIHGSEKLPESISQILKKKKHNDTEVKWRVLSGKMNSSDSNSMLSKAVSIFHDRFDPIVDQKTKNDLIPTMVNGTATMDQDFGGMYCAVLTVNDAVVSAGILRIFGREVAELPLVATNTDYEGKGYFQTLFACMERLLGFLRVKNLVLPAAEEAKSIWTDKFGFHDIAQDQLTEFRKMSQIMTFQGTSMLQKPVPRIRLVEKGIKDSI